MGREGYPENLSEFDIPLAARIVSLANVYDSLTSPRVYKEVWSHDNTIEYKVEGLSTQFDPLLMEILKELDKEFRAIRENWKE
jgi:putative two-component system response regulator